MLSLLFLFAPEQPRRVQTRAQRWSPRGEGPASDEIHCRPAGGVSARVKNSGFSPGLRESARFLSFFRLHSVHIWGGMP